MIQVINRAVNILDIVAQSDGPVQLPEIIEKSGLSASTTANIISSLVQNRLLNRGGDKRQYRYTIGPKFHEFSQKYVSSDYVKKLSMTAMDAFAMENEVSCILANVDHQNRVIIHESKPNTRIQVVHHQRYPAWASSMGRFILAHFTLEELHEYVLKIGMPTAEQWQEFESVEALYQSLENVKNTLQRPTVVEKDHVVMYFSPIIYAKQIIAAVGLYLPLSNYTEQSILAIQENFNQLVSFIYSYLTE